MSREKTSITAKEFAKYKTVLFAGASDELKSFAKKLSDYCWVMDELAVIQEWGGEKEALIAFGVPPQYRKRSNARNYFAIYKVLSSEESTLKCEVCFPTDSSREALLEKHDTERRLHISTINQCEGTFRPSDFEYLKKMINIARCCRIG